MYEKNTWEVNTAQNSTCTMEKASTKEDIGAHRSQKAPGKNKVTFKLRSQSVKLKDKETMLQSERIRFYKGFQ